MKLISYWKEHDSKYLVKLLSDNKSRYTLPSYDDVIIFLSQKDLYEFEEEVIDDLIIRFEDSRFELSLC